mmetsp:Transcript_131488/g.366464  ORF Transcript_131488/g.366464 Transcript_131488/m.366464 type:complete len:654 (+) Transcript_131488:107-2068(+)
MRPRASARHEDPQRPALLATPAARTGESSLPALTKPTTQAGDTGLPTRTLAPLASSALTGQRAISSPALTSPRGGREAASRVRRCDSRAGSTTGGSDGSGNAAVGALLTGAASGSTRGAKAEGAEALSAWAVPAGGQEGLQPNLVAAMEQAMKPLIERLQDNGREVRKLIHTFGETTRRLEDRLQEEQTHADRRFRQHEERLRKQAESQLSQHLEAVQHLQWKVQQQPPAGTTSSREHGSSVMRQDTPTEAVHARLQGSRERSGGTTPELMAEGAVEPGLANAPGWLQPAQAQDKHEQLAEGPAFTPSLAPKEELGGSFTPLTPSHGARASSQHCKFGGTTSLMPKEEDLFAKSLKSGRLARMCSFKPAESKSCFLENRPTLCGFEYGEVKHYHRTSGTLMQRRFFALLLRWMDLLYSLQEPGGDIFYYLYMGRELSSRGQYEGLTSAQAGAFAAALRGATQFQFQYEENNFTCGQMTTGRFYKQARCADIVSGYQMEHRLRYNVLIYTRPDLFYEAPLPSLIGLIRYSPLTFASFRYGDLVAMSGGALGLAMHLPNATCCNLTTREPGGCFYGKVPEPRSNFIFERHFLSQGCARAKVPKWSSSPWFKHWNPGKFHGKFRSEVEHRAVPRTSAVLSSIDLIRAALPEGEDPG